MGVLARGEIPRPGGWRGQHRARRALRRLSTGHRGKHSWYDSRKHTHGHGCKHDPEVSRRRKYDEGRAPLLRFRTDESRFDSWRERGSILERASRGGLPLGPGPKRLRRPPLFLAAIAGSPRARGVCEARAKSNVGNGYIFGLEVPVGAPYGRVTFAKMPSCGGGGISEGGSLPLTVGNLY